MDFLGQRVTKYGINTKTEDLGKLITIENLANKKLVQKTVDIMQGFRSYSRDLSKTIAPITDILKKNVTFSWTNIHEMIRQKVITDIKESMTFIYPDINQDFILECNCSIIGLGYVLTLKGLNNKRRE